MIPYNKQKYIPKIKEEFLFSKVSDHLKKFPDHKIDHVLSNIKLAENTKLFNQQQQLFRKCKLNKAHQKNIEIILKDREQKEIEHIESMRVKKDRWHDFRERR